jgi:formylglycine-generating enzyme required for sulfatase activity
MTDLANTANVKITPKLKNEFASGRIVPFVGSGVSLAVKESLFPTWAGLFKDMESALRVMNKERRADQVKIHCEFNEWLDAAKVAWKELGKNGFHDVMLKRFKIEKPADANWSLPDAIWDLKPRVVITTNYDDVLSWRKPNSKQLLNRQKPELARLYRDATVENPCVWHLHGHISDLDSLILAPSQYDDFYAADCRVNYEAAMAQLKSLLTNWTLLFIGFGLEDQYVMDMVVEVYKTFGEASSPHFALKKKGEPDSEKSRIWDKYNIQVIEYEDYGQPLVDLLHGLSNVGTRVPEVTFPPDRPVVPAAYTDWLIKDCSKDIELLGLRPKIGHSVTLRNVYVPVVTQNREPQSKISGHIRIELQTPGSAESRTKSRLLQSIIAEKSIYLSGAPGSGKTTFCRWLTLAICQGELTTHSVAPPEGFLETFPEPLRGLLPILIKLREFWEFLPNLDQGAELTRYQFESVMKQWIEGKKFDGLAWSTVQDHLEAGLTLLIFDGVDEVPLERTKPDRAAEPRILLLSGLSNAINHWTSKGNRVLVTSRPYGLTDAQSRRLGLDHEPVAELPRELQELLVRRWFHVLRKNEEEAVAECGRLWGDVANRPEIASLASNPLLLTAICIVYGEKHRLPQHEYDLYERIVNTVLSNRNQEESHQFAAARSSLCVIAHGMHTGEGLGEVRQQPQAEATFDEIERMLKYYEDHRPGGDRRILSAHDTREELLSQSGLLLPQGDKSASFYHFTIQDFLAAERLYEQHFEDLKPVFLERGDIPEWRKSLGLLYGAPLNNITIKDRAIRLLSDLSKELSIHRLRLGIVLCDCWRILHGHELRLDAEAQQRFVDFCVNAINPEVPAKDRMELALALGRMGDPRVATDLRDPATWLDNRSTWVTVKPGVYNVGDANILKEDGPDAALKPEKFQLKQAIQLSRFPVTNGQFAAFIADGGYREATYWMDEMGDEDGWKWRQRGNITLPAFWNDSKWNGETQPVVGVSWFEAMAYCRWANCRLPAEREWESAARGPNGWEYPWGNDWRDGICNSYETDLDVTTPVGIFTKSQAPCGASDMAGNVWEWCADWYNSKTKDARVVRGGSWLNNLRYERSAFRHWNSPADRGEALGFRVVSLRQDSNFP